MSDNRETIKITTPVKKHKVVLKAWINGREKQKIDGAMVKSVGTTGTGKNITPTMSDTILADNDNAAIENIVISVDGSEENILDTVLDMRAQDFQFVVDAANNIVDGELDEKKATSSKSNTTKP